MKPSEYCKSKGLLLKDIVELTGQSLPTLNNWWKNKKGLFKIVVDGCVIAKGIK